jgi:hypothetical protein
MRLDTIHKTVNGKTYTSHLLRHAYRDHGKVRHRTIANLTGYHIVPWNCDIIYENRPLSPDAGFRRNGFCKADTQNSRRLC